MRPVVSYDDISLPHAGVFGPNVSFDKPPPSKKRRRSSLKASQHWDDPGCTDEAMYYDENTPDAPANAPRDDVVLDVEGDEESHELTYDEIWDDSALINAWNAATEEYEAHHGGEKNWKKESITKSALWYNVPPSPSRKKPKVQAQSVDTAPKLATLVDDTINDAGGQDDSHPLNFDTFVPTYDPSLDLPVPSQQYLPYPEGPLPSKEEAFTRALGAMYWGGYWTAVYHCRSNRETESPMAGEDDTEVQEETLIK